MGDFNYANKEADYSSAEPLILSESYETNTTRPRSLWMVVSWTFHLTSLVVICILWTKLAMKVNVGMDLACLQLESAWCKLESTLEGHLSLSVFKAPALEAALPLRGVRFNGTLDYPSPFRGTPGPEVDAAWETVTHSNDGK